MKLILHKIKKTFQLLRCSISSTYAQHYYTNLLTKSLQVCGTNVVFKGRSRVSDKRQLCIGSNVSIGNNTFFLSSGGIYLEDHCVIEDDVKVLTCPENFEIARLGCENLNVLKPVIVKSGAVVKKGTILQPGQIIEKKTNNTYPTTLENNNKPYQNLFFIVSTGRSGTNAIAKTLNKHPQINCIHEARYVLNRLSTELEHNIKSREEVKQELTTLFLHITSVQTHKEVYGECDLKNSNLIPLLSEIFPHAKFVWLIRRADEFVASAFGRRWFDEYEYTYPNGRPSFDTSNDLSIFEPYRMEYAIYRVNGYKNGSFSKEQWENMSCFERCCWYWSFWNEKIESDLSLLDKKKFIQVKLEELNSKMPELFEFLNVPTNAISAEHTNHAYHEVLKSRDWTNDQKKHYEHWCQSGMKKWYA